jgi:hypothetical protein
LQLSIARTVDDVIEAWQLVYFAYRRAKLIDANPFRLHTPPQAIGSSTLVLIGRLGYMAANTISGYVDRTGSLPLDTVYADELGTLRKQGRRLMEIGLFADRRDHVQRSAKGLLDLMRFMFFFAKHGGVDDVVIGIHPSHAAFYQRMFAFQPTGQIRKYPVVNNAPVRLLRVDMHAIMKIDPLPRGLAFFASHQLPSIAFKDRYLFDDPALRNSPIVKYLAYKNHAQRAA